ncbi:MAG: P-loop NTPase fold protein [Candidatus Sericytochromatia bacterium]
MENIDKEYIIEIIKKYLENTSTNYAILIDGHWGSGKTFFLKNILKEKIENEVLTPISTHYRLIYISLYGISSIDELISKIDYETLALNIEKSIENEKIPEIVKKFTKSKEVKELVKVSRNILDLYMKSKFKTGIDTLVNGIDFSILDTIKAEEKVFCFDDLERINFEKLNITEVLGYINSFVEHESIKTIIVAHEDKIPNHTDKNEKSYKDIKEKLIGRTLSFKPHIESVIDSLIELFNDVDYKNFLNLHKNLIINLFKIGGNNNLRNLQFTLNNLQVIFNSYKGINFPNLHESTVSFTFYISLEYKNNNIDNNFLTKINREIYSFYLYDDEENKILLNKINSYYNYSSIDYKYINEIAIFILTGYLNSEKLKDELNSKFNPDNKNSIDSLLTDPRRLSNNKFNEKIIDALTLVKNGDKSIGIYKYFEIAKFLFNFNNQGLINKNIIEIKNLIIDGINTSISKDNLEYSGYFDNFELDLNVHGLNNQNELNEIKNKIQKTLVELKNKKEVSIKKQMESLLNEPENNLFKEVISKQEYYMRHNLFYYLSAKDMYKKITESSSDYIRNFEILIEIFYKEKDNIYIFPHLKKGLKNLKYLAEKLQAEYLSENKHIFPKTMETYNIEFLLRTINEIINEKINDT